MMDILGLEHAIDAMQLALVYTVPDMSGHILFPYVSYKEIFRKFHFIPCAHCIITT